MEGILKKRICLQAIREEAEAYYRNGDFYCSEAIVATIRQHFDAEIPIEAVAMASGFPVGVGGAKCICGLSFRRGYVSGLLFWSDRSQRRTSK